MPRSRVVVVLVVLAAHGFAANQAVESFRVAKPAIADAQQESLEAISPESKQAVEVFPGAYESPFGAGVVRRVETLLGRVDPADREALIKTKTGGNFDRSILRWRARTDGRTVALAVRYYRDQLFRLELKMSDDYGSADPVDPARYEFFTIAVCTRAGGEAWKCGEQLLADVAERQKMPPPQTRAERIAAAEKLVDIVLAGK